MPQPDGRLGPEGGEREKGQKPPSPSGPGVLLPGLEASPLSASPRAGLEPREDLALTSRSHSLHRNLTRGRSEISFQFLCPFGI